MATIRAADFTGSIGVNTHIDFNWTSYKNIQLVENAINYIGVKNLRDSAANPADIGAHGLWQQVADATGAKFDAFIASTSKAGMSSGLESIKKLAAQGILNYVEGGNEEDNSYAASQGNTLQYSAQFQQQVYATGHQYGLPVINMSFGAGWGADPLHGNYDNAGNLTAYADYSNAHTYFGTGNTPQYTINLNNGNAQMAAQRPVIATELGWYTTGNVNDPSAVSDTVQAKYMLEALFDSYKAGTVKTYLYELLDQAKSTGNEQNFGLFNADGTPKMAANALHNLTTLLADNGANAHSFGAHTLNYSLSGLQSTDQTFLMEKSDGSFWLAIWNESRLQSATKPVEVAVANHNINLTLGGGNANIVVYDPLTGMSAVKSANGVNSVQLSLPDHPILVQIIPPTSSSTPVQDSGTHQAPDPVPVFDVHDMKVAVPTTVQAVNVGNSVQLTGIDVNSDWSAHNSGYMTLNLNAALGTLSMKDASGNLIAGSGGKGMTYTASYADINHALDTLTYKAGGMSGADKLVVDIWNQGGLETTKSIDLKVGTVATQNALSIISPTSVTDGLGEKMALKGIAISDDWAAHQQGLMALNLSVTNGTITALNNGTGAAVAGSGTNYIHLAGTYDELNKELSSLTYSSPGTAANATLSVNVWNQAGVSVTNKIVIKDMNLSGGNTVTGTTGNDILNGSAGADKLTGGAGADTFYFAKGATGIGSAADHITDFNVDAGDKIQLAGFGMSAGGNYRGTFDLMAKSFGFTYGYDANHNEITTVNIDSNGDKIADHQIVLDGGHHALTDSSFIFS